MARHRDGRSPSPAGTSRAERSYRDDRRYRDDGRDDRGGNRRRTRSRSVERRRHDRDYRKDRDRSPGRLDDRRRDDHRRRDRSPARNRDRDYRDRSRDRDRDHRSRRDDSRSRRKGDDTADRHSARRDRSRDTLKNGDYARSRDKTRESTPKSQSGEATAASAADEKKQEERRAKVADLKKKLEAKKQQESINQQHSVGGVKAILAEMDKPPAGHPAPSDDVEPIQGTPEPVETAKPEIPALAKFDPKALVKKASTTASGPVALGGDIAIPQAQKPQGALTHTNGLAGQSNGTTAKTKLARGAKLSAFEISSKQEKGEGKRTIDLDDDDSSRQKLQKLPTNGSALLTDTIENDKDAGDVDDEEGSMDADNEEEDAAAARLAAERREEQRQQQLNANAEEMTGVIAEADADQEVSEPVAIEIEEAAEEEEDPLDAYMKNINTTTGQVKPKKKTVSTLPGKKRKFEAEAFFGDETDDREAVGDANDDIIALAAKRAKKKDIPAVNHSKMNYEPFKKNFYVPPSELANLTPEAVADMRLELDGIKVKGTDVPAPVENWAQCGLGLQTLDVIAKLGYTRPTSIQAQAIPAIMSGRDIIGVAKTGSGKTAAFLMPMFRHIKDQRPIANMEGPIGLIIAPTRELAQQIHRDCKPFLKALGLRAACTYGGAPIKDQIADLKRGAEIIVCTTGRIIELLSANQGRVTNLSRVTYVVLDEADRMFDMGFEPQIMKILGNIRPDRQTVLFSATFPRQMEALARKVLRKPIEIQVGGRSTVAPEITQIVEVLEEEQKFKRLLEMLGELYANDEDVRSLIFVERHEGADRLLSELLRKGYPCMSIHGGKDQIDRDSTIDDFKKGIFPIMIATSVAARGLDVKQLKLVVNYDCPNHLEDYVHRVGRTGRAGNTGTALTFVTPEQEKFAVDISKALRQSGQEVPPDVQKLADSFMEKVKAGKAEATGRGFGGKGIDQYDEKRAATRRAERNQYKTGDEPEEVDEEAEKKLDDEIAVKTGVAPIVAREAPRAATPEVDTGGPRFDLNTIVIHKTERPAPSGEQSGSALDKVRLASQRIGNRLSQRGHIYPGQPIDNRGPDAGAYHTTLSINDFPQKARWAVTNRTNVAKILDTTQTSITTKGNFYGNGTEPAEGEPPKLYILIEGDSEHQVKTAVGELDRLLRDATAASIITAAAKPVAGRYSVL